MTAKQLMAARKKLGLSQEKLGHAIGVSYRTVIKWEKGAGVRKIKDAEAINRLLAISK